MTLSKPPGDNEIFLLYFACYCIIPIATYNFFFTFIQLRCIIYTVSFTLWSHNSTLLQTGRFSICTQSIPAGFSSPPLFFTVKWWLLARGSHKNSLVFAVMILQLYWWQKECQIVYCVAPLCIVITLTIFTSSLLMCLILSLLSRKNHVRVMILIMCFL